MTTPIAAASLADTVGGADVESVASRITVAMITKNEAQAVGKVIADITTVVPQADILIVDSSSDRTAEIAQSLGARVLRQFPPRGYGLAMDMALRMSTREIVVTLDCDDTYPVEFIEPMARMILEDGYDLVDGSRLNGKPAAMPWLNFLANWTFGLFASLLFFRRLPDLHSGMRAYRKSLIDKLHYSPAGAALPVELLLRTIRDGYKVKVITIPYRPRIGESTLLPLQSAWWTLKRILLSRFA